MLVIWCPFPSPLASARRRSISSVSIPASATVLSREACPETISTSRSEMPSVSASSRTTAAFAFPSSGAAVTRTFQAGPCRPTIAGDDAPGDTRSLRRELTESVALTIVLPPGEVRPGWTVVVLRPD